MTAMDGIGSASSLANTAWPSSAPRFCAIRSRLRSSLMSAPAQNALVPAPVMISARAFDLATSSKARADVVDDLERQRVQRFRPVQREDGEFLARSQLDGHHATSCLLL